jgi:hypothetical protein
LGRDAGGFEDSQDEREGFAIRGGAGNVTDADGGRALAEGELAQGRATEGVFEGGAQGGGFVREGGGAFGFEEKVVGTGGEGDVEAGFAESEVDMHIRKLAQENSFDTFGPIVALFPRRR